MSRRSFPILIPSCMGMLKTVTSKLHINISKPNAIRVFDLTELHSPSFPMLVFTNDVNT